MQFFLQHLSLIQKKKNPPHISVMKFCSSLLPHRNSQPSCTYIPNLLFVTSFISFFLSFSQYVWVIRCQIYRKPDHNLLHPLTTLHLSLTTAQPSTCPLPCACIPRAAAHFDFMRHISYVIVPLVLLCKNLLVHQKISDLNLDFKSIRSR